eukprot:621326-Amphidinium_carterae.3
MATEAYFPSFISCAQAVRQSVFIRALVRQTRRPRNQSRSSAILVNPAFRRYAALHGENAFSA